MLRIFRPPGVRILATGSYLPERVVANAELAALGAPLSDEEIVRLSGIRARRWAAPGEATSDLAAQAARAALARAPGAVDRLVVATVSPDHPSPSCACLVHAALGLGLAPALDVVASCSGFLYALDAAARAVATGEERVLAVAADIRSRFLDLGDRATCALFGDGAGAAIVGRGPEGSGLVAIGLAADGSGARSVYVPGGGSREPDGPRTIRMADGPQVYLQAVEGMVAAARALLDATGGAADLVIAHQANRRILDRLGKLTGLPMFINVDQVGNISGATVAVALDQALTSGRIGPGARVLLVSAGAGYTVGAALLVVDDELCSRMRPCA
jgi:3-oxoacyl-[acyl-carrier-protein] synthase-3